MTTIAILPQNSVAPGTTYRAISGKRYSVGKTAGEALDGLTSQLQPDEKGTLIVVQHMQPDRFFSRDQQQRLEELMLRWRAARDSHQKLPPDEQAELETLVTAEWQAATQRAAALVSEIDR